LHARPYATAFIVRGPLVSTLFEHRPSELLDARLVVFNRWTNAVHAGSLHKDARQHWDEYRDDVMIALSRSPTEGVTFALSSLKGVRLAWDLAHSLDLGDDYL
jgi:hypothetical protein